MPQQKLIVYNIGIFFEDTAPAVYPWILDKLGRGGESLAIQAKYESRKAAGPGLLPEMARLFEGVNQKKVKVFCRQYCLMFSRREAFEVLQRLNEREYWSMFVTSLPSNLVEEFSVLMLEHCLFVASYIFSKPPGLQDRETRKDLMMEFLENRIDKRCIPPVAYRNWEDVLIIGQSLTDIPLGKAVQEKGGRFIAFKPKDGEIKKAVDQYYQDFFLTRMFETEGLI
jgi:phosphoserine phosphatase